jgi:phosphopantetheine--protein transferase-like protein
MEIIGVGIDIVDIARVRALRHLERAAELMLVSEEREAMHTSRDAAQFFATRLALKEAVIKALPFPSHYHDFCIEKQGEKLQVRFMTPTSTQMYRTAVSAAHEFKHAIGHAIVWML